MNYYRVDPAQQWRAGFTGKEMKTFYWDCADCGAKEPLIAGIISKDGTFRGIGVLPPRDGAAIGYRPAMFCQACFAKRLETSGGVT